MNIKFSIYILLISVGDDRDKVIPDPDTSLAGSSAGDESSDDLVSAPAAIDERVITNQVLGVWRGHCKSVGRIIKGRKKALDTASSSTATGLSEQ